MPNVHTPERGFSESFPAYKRRRIESKRIMLRQTNPSKGMNPDPIYNRRRGAARSNF